MKVIVLLSTYNGEKFLQSQLDSILAQDLCNNAEILIFVRDDGSSDNTQNILQEYKKQKNLNWYTGVNIKPAKSFWHLLNHCPDADYYAFCDQDDIWFTDKLSRAVNTIQSLSNQNQPILYCSSVTVTDASLNPIKNNTRNKVYTDFAHALIYSLAPGCTFVFNHYAKNLLTSYDIDNNYVIMHDWLVHKIIAMMGIVLYDHNPTMYYRQHGNNVIGATKGGVKSFFTKLNRMLTIDRRVRSLSAKSLLNVYYEYIDDDVKDILNMVSSYYKEKKLKQKFLQSTLFSVGGISDIYLKLLIHMDLI